MMAITLWEPLPEQDADETFLVRRRLRLGLIGPHRFMAERTDLQDVRACLSALVVLSTEPKAMDGSMFSTVRVRSPHYMEGSHRRH